MRLLALPLLNQLYRHPKVPGAETKISKKIKKWPFGKQFARRKWPAVFPRIARGCCWVRPRGRLHLPLRPRDYSYEAAPVGDSSLGGQPRLPGMSSSARSWA